ncbi:MAG: choice-of-anchor D domain-containing protein [Ignavibacteria bacterium]|nr:choice-of-anchor D domain-containing protein [Ignavibacteria bacterium]
MKKMFILLFFLVIINFHDLFSQSFNLYSIDTSGFPNMKALFYARTQMGADYPNILPTDFDFYENGVNLNTTLGVDCKKVDFYPQLAVVLVLDVSTSMNEDAGNGERRIDWVKQGAFAFLDSIKLDPPSVIGFVLFAGDVYKTSPLYDTKQPLYDWLNINLTIAAGSTDFYPPFVKPWPPLGALPLLETAPKDLRRVVIFLTDGQPERPFPDWKRDTIISYAKRIKAQVYSIFITMPLYSQIDFICQATAGKSFSVYTKQQLINAFRQIVGDIQSRNVCYLTWVSPFGCNEASRNRNIKAFFKRIPDSVSTSYYAPEKSIAKLEFSDTLLLFGAPGIGTTLRQLTLKAVNSDFVVNSFNLSTIGKFSVDWKGKNPPFTLSKGQTHTIEISYIETPVGASSETNFQINASPCTPPAVKLIAPCGGDVVSKIDFGKVPIQTTKNVAQNCIFRNTTAIPLVFTLGIEGVDANEFTIINGTGPYTLNPNECLSITVQFKPQTIGVKSARLKFYIPNYCGEFFTNLSGEGIPSNLPIPPIDFGVKRILTINDSTIKITNNSPNAIEIQGIDLYDKTDVNFTIIPPSNLPIIVPSKDTFDLSVRFYPHLEGYLENQIVLNVKDFPEPAKVQVFGTGGLPWIEVHDVDCGKAKVGNTVTGNLVITNSSQTMDLFISDVVLQPSSEFKFGNGAKTTNIIVGKNGGTFTIPIDFTPSAPGTRKIFAIVKSDAAPGPSRNPLVNDTVIIFGIGEGLILNPDPIDFGEVSSCTTKEINVEIDNSPFDSDLQINSLSIQGTDASNFRIVSYPTSIKRKDKGVVIVSFNPTSGKTYFSAYLDLLTNFGERKVPLIGKVFTENVAVDYKVNQNKLQVSKELQLPFEVNITRDHNIKIGRMDLEVNLPKKSFVLTNFSSKLVGWNWNITSTDNGYLISGSGTPFSTPAQFQNTLTFETYLSSESKPEIKIKPIFPEAQSCLIPTEKSQLVNLITCFTEGRLVEVSEKNYKLIEIQPNPVSGDFDISFEIAFDDFVNVSIYNSFGERIKEVVSSHLRAGSYSFYINTVEFAEGIYFVQMKTNGFYFVKSFVLVK